jgi:hypothetical protein
MIIVPEKEIVLITPPRTGSTTISDQILAKYPLAFRPYRHMEADGTPFGYDRWRRVGVFREPVARLWSVYHYCKTMVNSGRGTQTWRDNMLRSVEVPFEEWLVDNTLLFADPFDSVGARYFPRYAVRHGIPENKKSLFHYLRPDLGTEVVTLAEAMTIFGLDIDAKANGSGCPPAPYMSELGREAHQHMRAFHGWDLRISWGPLIEAAA